MLEQTNLHQKLLDPNIFFINSIVININSTFTGKQVYWSLSNKIAGFRPATLLKKRLRHRCLPVNLVKF